MAQAAFLCGACLIYGFPSASTGLKFEGAAEDQDAHNHVGLATLSTVAESHQNATIATRVPLDVDRTTAQRPRKFHRQLTQTHFALRNALASAESESNPLDKANQTDADKTPTGNKKAQTAPARNAIAEPIDQELQKTSKRADAMQGFTDMTGVIVSQGGRWLQRWQMWQKSLMASLRSSMILLNSTGIPGATPGERSWGDVATTVVIYMLLAFLAGAIAFKILGIV